MSRHTFASRPAASARRLTALIILAAIAALALLSAAPTGPLAPASATATTKPVGYYMFRTRDTGTAATNEQNSRCNNYFGLSSLFAISRLNAQLFAYEADPATGRITNQTKSLLGPGFICAVPTGGGADPLAAYAYSSLPGPGLVEATGGCGLTSIVVENLPAVLNCRLNVRAKPAVGVEGGLITSNSLVNILNRSDTAPTGSVWTAQIVGNAVNPGGAPGPVPPGTQPETPGLDFFTVRTRANIIRSNAPECESVGVSSPSIVRQTALVAVQPDPVSGKVPEPGSRPTVGSLTICFQSPINGGMRAAMVAKLNTGTRPITVSARGTCRDSTTVAAASLRAQGCAFQVYRGDVQAGLITSNGLIHAGEPARSADSGAWTFALFGV